LEASKPMGLNRITKILILFCGWTLPFDFEHTWWRWFQKRTVHTKFDIYGLIVI